MAAPRRLLRHFLDRLLDRFLDRHELANKKFPSRRVVMGRDGHEGQRCGQWSGLSSSSQSLTCHLCYLLPSSVHLPSRYRCRRLTEMFLFILMLFSVRFLFKKEPEDAARVCKAVQPVSHLPYPGVSKPSAAQLGNWNLFDALPSLSPSLLVSGWTVWTDTRHHASDGLGGRLRRRERESGRLSLHSLPHSFKASLTPLPLTRCTDKQKICPPADKRRSLTGSAQETASRG